MGSPKVTLGSPPVSPFCINVENLEGKRTFSQLDGKAILQEELFLFAIKNYGFPVGERWVKFPNVMQWMVERRTILFFKLLSINREIVLTLRTYVLV